MDTECVFFTTVKENQLCLVNISFDMVGVSFGIPFLFRLRQEVGLEMVLKNQQQAPGEEC